MKQSLFSIAIAASLFLVAGCNMGNAPEPMSAGEARSALDKLSPQDKIKYYASSPMSPAEKQQKYEEIEKATGVKASDVLGGGFNSGPGGGGPAQGR